MRCANLLALGLACASAHAARADGPAPASGAAAAPTGAAPADPAAAPDAGASAAPSVGAAIAVPVATTAAANKQPIIGFEVRGHSKVRPETLSYLARVPVGSPIGPDDVPQLEQALLSSELFRTVAVTLEPAPGTPSPGAIVVATVDDKHSWIIAPTAFALPGNLAFGVGYAENNFRGRAQKYLLYGQIGTGTSLFFGTFYDPSYHGTPLLWRTDVYAYRRTLSEYANPHDDPRSFEVARTTRSTYLGGGALIGWRFLWWLSADVRLRGAYVYFRDTRDAADQPVAAPQHDGWDVSLQTHLTIDHRQHRYGVTWGTYAQIATDTAVPGIDEYGYQLLRMRAYQSWRLFGEHELELRGYLDLGRQLPLHEDMSIGGVSDLRGYNVDQFVGDTRAVARAEYSVPIARWRFLSFRALAFYDTGYVGFHHRRADRDYLPEQRGPGYTRNDLGGGLRVYLDNIVLPLLGFDVGYGLEGHSPQIYFEVGLTDF